MNTDIEKLNLLNKTQIILGILLVNLVIRYFFFINLDENILNFSDQTKYITISNILLDKFNLIDSHTLQRVPIYPLFLFILRSIFDNLFFVILIQNLIGILTIFLIYNCSKQIEKKSSLLITFIFSINLNIIFYQNLILTESIFVTFFISSIYFLIKFLKSHKLKNLIFFSFFIALCALIRPQIYYFYLLIFIVFFFLLPNSTMKKIKFYLIFIIIFKSCLFIWEYRNYKIYNNYFFVIAKEVNLIGYYLPHFDQYEHKLSLNDAKKERKLKWKKYLNDNYKNQLNILENDVSKLLVKEKIATKYSFEELFKYKLTSIIQGYFFGSAKTIFAPNFVDIGYFYQFKKNSFSSTMGSSFFEQLNNFIKINYKKNPKYIYLLIISLFFLLIFRVIQIYGLIIFFRQNVKLSILFFLIIVFFLILLGPLGAPKYRIPFEYFLSLYFAIGLINMKNLLSKKIKK